MRCGNSRHTLKSLRCELAAWQAHTARLGLDDRRRFVEWLSKSLDAQEFALAIDCEVGRRALWKVFLRELYGP
jgi:hypothetical protein